MNDMININYIAGAIVYSLIGILILVITFWIIEKLTPQNLVLEVIDKKNMAVAVIAGSGIIAIAIIISSAIHG
jgi:putative membrane protein